MGDCIPPKILGPHGYIATNQNQIESIRLIMHPACLIDFNFTEEFAPVTDLSAFHHLKSISWTGIRLVEDFRVIKRAIEHNAGHLRQLEIDFLDSEYMEHSQEDDHLLWGGEEDHENDLEHYWWPAFLLSRTNLPALEALSLSAVTLWGYEKQFARVMNLSSLQSLKLRWCTGWEKFLRSLARSFVRSDGPIALRTLDIQQPLGSEPPWTGEEALSGILDSFQGLTELSVASWKACTFNQKFWASVLGHKSTLRTLVYHVRMINVAEDRRAALQCGMPDMLIPPKSATETEEFKSENPFKNLDLESIGICCEPVFLVLTPLSHVRRCFKTFRLNIE